MMDKEERFRGLSMARHCTLYRYIDIYGTSMALLISANQNPKYLDLAVPRGTIPGTINGITQQSRHMVTAPLCDCEMVLCYRMLM